MNIDERWQRHNNNLNAIPADTIEFLDHPYFRKFLMCPFNKNTKMCESQINHLLKTIEIKDGDSVLEMGGGYGNFCRVFQSKKNVKYSILDNEAMLKFVKTFHKHYNVQCDYYNSFNPDELFGKKFDLFTSHLCMSETPEEYREKIVDNIFPNCRKVFMIDHDGSSDYDNWLEKKLKIYFTKVSVSPISRDICYHPKMKLFVGQK